MATSHAEHIARQFHESYERLAPEHGWETQERSRREWDDLPPDNKALMLAVVADLLTRGVIPTNQWHCRPSGPHTNPSPSQAPGAWCNTCGAFVPLHHFDPRPDSYLVDGRPQAGVPTLDLLEREA